MAALNPIRLLKPYRSFREGDVIQATQPLARRLIALGVACEDLQGRGVPLRAAVERAVCHVRHEVR